MEKIRELLYKRLYGADKILMQDYDNYCPYKDASGGQYLDETEYVKVGDGEYEEYHYSSADFDFCPIYGQFRSCYDCFAYNEDEGCKAKPYKVEITDIIDSIVQALMRKDNIQVFAWFDDKKELIVTCDHHYPGYCSICNDEYRYGSYIVEEEIYGT